MKPARLVRRVPPLTFERITQVIDCRDGALTIGPPAVSGLDVDLGTQLDRRESHGEPKMGMMP